MATATRRPASAIPKPPTAISSSCVIAETATLVGTGLITISANAVLHPRAKIVSTYGPVTLNEGCVVCERACVGLLTAEEDEDAPAIAGVTLEKNVTVEAAATVEASFIGEGTIIECGAKIGRGALLGKVCLLSNTLKLPKLIPTASFAKSHRSQKLLQMKYFQISRSFMAKVSDEPSSLVLRV